jgi:dipeptidyl aminopeptidase/acylaminoacyl peptidase
MCSTTLLHAALVLLTISNVQSFSLPTQTAFTRTSTIGRHANGDALPLRAAAGTDTNSKKQNVDVGVVPLIPRDVLFGNPKYASPTLSPDGKYLAYLAPSLDLGVLNVWVRDTYAAATARQITNDTARGIRSVTWAEDCRHVLYMQDHEGDENFHLWAVDAITNSTSQLPLTARELTPGPNVKASSVITNKRYPNELLVATNQRDPSQFDMYRCHLPTGQLALDTQNPGDVVGWGAEDESFTVRMASVRNQDDSSNTVRVRDSCGSSNNSSEWRDLITFPYGEEGSFVDFCMDGGSSCYITSTLGRETKALLRVDLKTGAVIEEVSQNDKCDVRGITLDQDTKAVRAVTFNYARTERVFFDPELDRDYAVLESMKPAGSEVGIASRTRDEKLWVVVFSRSDGPSEYVLYDQVNKTTTPLFVSRPELLNYQLQMMEDVRIKARDGLELVGYLTRTASDDKGEKAPLILLVHGGPWARDFWGYSPQAQWFANRGYSVLQVNFRGSTGYGKSFLHKGDKQWGVGDMQHDLTDSVQWAIEQGIADQDRICIYGGSYGGYACLAGLAFTPDLYACGVDIVGPSNVKTLLDSIPAYWGPLRNGMLLKIGDVDSDEEFNEKISPLFHIDNIKAPLMIGQGANDPRVKQTEADQIAFSMHEKGIPVEYVLYPDEGHGFARPDNRIDFNGRVELFLEKHLGGRSETFVRPEGSTAMFPLVDKQ